MLTIGGRDISRIVNHLVFLEFSNWSFIEFITNQLHAIQLYHNTVFPNPYTTNNISSAIALTTTILQSNKKKNPRIQSTTNLHKNEIQSTTRHNPKIIHDLQGDVPLPTCQCELNLILFVTPTTPQLLEADVDAWSPGKIGLILDRNNFPTPLMTWIPNSKLTQIEATDMAEECQRCRRDACGVRRNKEALERPRRWRHAHADYRWPGRPPTKVPSIND